MKQLPRSPSIWLHGTSKRPREPNRPDCLKCDTVDLGLPQCITRFGVYKHFRMRLFPNAMANWFFRSSTIQRQHVLTRHVYYDTKLGVRGSLEVETNGISSFALVATLVCVTNHNCGALFCARADSEMASLVLLLSHHEFYLSCPSLAHSCMFSIPVLHDSRMLKDSPKPGHNHDPIQPRRFYGLSGAPRLEWPVAGRMKWP